MEGTQGALANVTLPSDLQQVQAKKYILLNKQTGIVAKQIIGRLETQSLYPWAVTTHSRWDKTDRHSSVVDTD